MRTRAWARTSAHLQRCWPRLFRRALQESHWRAFRGTVDSGNVGNLGSLDAETNIRLEPALGGGSLLDVGSYCVSLLRLVTGEEPDQVRSCATFGPSGVDVQHAGVLHFPSGALGHFDCGIRGAPAQGYEVRGTKGRLVVERGFTMEPDEAPVLRVWRGSKMEQEEIAPTNHFTKMAEEFGEALLQRRPLRYPASDAVKNHRVLDALFEAARAS
ncbi:MAG: Gfo/Idh/MocA family oxidoreductase [Myxococcaceae bacterium]